MFGLLPRAYQLGAALAVLGAVGCGDFDFSTGPAESVRQVRLRLVADLSGTDVQTLVAQVTAADIDGRLLFETEVDRGKIALTLNVPVGSRRRITLLGLDGEGTETHRGAATVNVRESGGPVVSITLAPLLGDRPIEAMIGSLIVTVDPGRGVLLSGEKVRLRARVVDGAGKELGSAVSWSSKRPQVARVDARGQVTGLAAGEVEIIARFGVGEGVARIQVLPNAVKAIADLGALGAGASLAFDVNRTGQAVGWSAIEEAHDPRAFSWTEASGPISLGTLGGNQSFAHSINDLGQVVGLSRTVEGDAHPFLWTVARGMLDLGTLGGRYAVARSVNDAGYVVGESETALGVVHAFIWSAATGMIELGTPSRVMSIAVAINAVGQVVGAVQVGPEATHAFVWSPAAGFEDIGTLGGPTSIARAINDRGEIVGASTTRSGDTHAFFWSRRRGMVDLETLGGRSSQAFGINRQGQVVGRSERPSGEPGAFLWTAELGLVDLGGLGGGGSEAYAISEDGIVVGRSVSSAGAKRATLWVIG